MTSIPTPAPVAPPRPASIALVAAPALWFAGWAVMRLRTGSGPGVAWTTAHSLWIVTFGLFAVGCVGLARLAGGRTAVTAAVVALAGAAATGVQMVVDLAVGFAPDQTTMSARYDSVFAVPGVKLICYDLGPVVFYVGLLALLVVAAVRRAAPAKLVVLAGVGIVAAGVGHGLPGVLRIVEGIGALLILAALAGIVRTRRTGTPRP